MKRCLSLLLLLALCAGTTWAEENEDRAKVLDRVQAASNVLNEIMAAPDKGIPQEILAASECVVVVPSMMKGGFIVGARYGKGIATCRTAGHGANKWSAPAPIRVEGGSLGFQIGGQAVDLVMLVMNNKGMQHLLSSKFQIGADASAAAGPVGRHVEAATDYKMRSEILTYSRARGAFAGVTLNGAVVRQDMDDTAALYGKDVSFRRILSGQTPPPSGTQQFLADVRKHFGESKSAAQGTSQEAEARTSHSAGETRSSGSGGISGSATKAEDQNQQSESTGSGVGSSTSHSGTAAGGTSTETTTSTSSGSGSSDQVRSNIKDALHNTSGLSTTNVNVNVTDSQVVLSGSVPNDRDKTTIHRIAEQNAAGRKVVDNDLVVK